MKKPGITAGLLALALPAAGQLTTDSFFLAGSYEVTAFSGSASGSFNTGLQPDEILELIPEATLGDESGLFAATFNGGFETERLDNGVRLFGSIFSSEQAVPFYEQRHDFSIGAGFELSEPTLVRIAGSILHDPTIVSDEIILLNGTNFSLQGDGIFLEESAGPTGLSAAFNEFDNTVLLPAGSYSAGVDSFSFVGGFSPGLTTVNTQWDISITVVPAPAGFGVLAGGLLLASRRRR